MKRIILFTILFFLILPGFLLWKFSDSEKKGNTRGLFESDINYVSKNYSSADKFISTISQQINENNENSNLYTKLGAAYIQKARETNDPSYYSKAEDAFEEALQIDDNNSNAMALLASVYLSRHNFEKALELGKKANEVNPYSGYTYSIIVDAQIELGLYKEAIESAQKMVDIHPDLTSYSRVSYLRELHGDLDGAIDAMKSAVNAGSSSAENTAWCKVQLGNLYYNSGDIEKARMFFESSMEDFDNYIHGIGGLAKIEMHKGNYQRTIELYEKALSINCLPEYLIALGDTYKLTGQNDEAQKQYNKVKSVLTVYKDNGIETDVELALFNADHNRKIDESIDKVKETMENGSQSIKTYHALAWLIYNKGNYTEAEQNIVQALRLGTKDPLMYFHAAKIYEKLGIPDKAKEYKDKALKINPYYQSLYTEN